MSTLRITIASMAGLALITSCGSETAPVGDALRFSEPAYEFGAVGYGSSASREITVTNQHDRYTDAIAVSLSGADSEEFRIDDDQCTGRILQGSLSCRLMVRLRPTSPGQKEARLTVRSGGHEATATLRGSGADAGLALRVGAHDFGTIRVAAPSTSYEFVIGNYSTARSGAIVTGLAGADASAFAITRDTCKGAELALGFTCAISVGFTPAAAGPATASLTISASPGGSAVAALTGLGGVAALLTAEPSSRDFGNVGASPDELPTAELVFRNTGSSATGRLSARFSGDNPSDFVSDASYCAGATLAPGQQCSTYIRFSPQGPGVRSAVYELTDALGTAVSVALSGSAEGVDIDIAIPSPGFPETDVGSFTEQIVRVTNRGNVATGAMSVTMGQCDYSGCGATPHFRVDADSCTGTALTPGTSCTFTATFGPQAAGVHYGRLEIVEQERYYVSVWGVGVAGLLELSRTRLSFAATALGASSAGQEVTVVNTGNHPTEPLSAGIEVCDWDYYCAPSPHFVLDPGTCAAAVLAPGAGCSLTVVFRPQAAGPQFASLKITDGWRSYWVALEGAGASP